MEMINIKYNVAKIYGTLIIILGTILMSFIFLSDYRYISYDDLEEVSVLDVVNFKDCDYCSYEVGIVTQVKDDKFLILYEKYNKTKFFNFNKKDIKNYQIVGKGTIYHKINIFYGYDIMYYNRILLIVLLVLCVLKWLSEVVGK